MYDDNNYPNDFYHKKVDGGTPIDAEEKTGADRYDIGYGSTVSRTAGQYTGSGQQSGQGQYTSQGQYGSTYQTGGDDGRPPHKKERKMGPYLKKVLTNVSLGLFFGVCAGLGILAVQTSGDLIGGSQEQQAAAIQEKPDSTSEKTEQAEAGSGNSVTATVEKTTPTPAVVMDVTDVVGEVMPSIVAINNTYTQTMSYFGQTMSSESSSAGSGIIVGESDTELLIVSNYHVVSDAEKLTVQFVDGTEAEAQIKGSDSSMDLAVIAVSLDSVDAATKEAIAVASLGDSDALTVGEPAIAIGNSLGYGQSVTVGVVSATNRILELSDEMNGTFIQTDAAINFGNSGGALLNMQGEVIGINSNKIGGNAIEGMGYAIPISAAKPIIEDLMLRETRDKVAEDNRGYLGVSLLNVVDQMTQDYGMPQGVYISQVFEGSAAEAAGIVKGNIITGFDGNKISSAEDLMRAMEYYSQGDQVDVTIMYGSPEGWESATVTVTLGAKS